MIKSVEIVNNGKLDIDPEHAWAVEKADEVARLYVWQWLDKALKADPGWKPKGFLPVVVYEDRDGSKVLHPFVFDLSKMNAN